MKIALASCPDLLYSREEALLEILRYLPYAHKAGCQALFFPPSMLGNDEGEEDRALPILKERAAFYGICLGFGYFKNGEEGYFVFSPDPEWHSLKQPSSFLLCGQKWALLPSEKETLPDAFSLCFLKGNDFSSFHPNPKGEKDCACFLSDPKRFNVGVFRGGKLLCQLKPGLEALLVKEIDL